MGGICVDSGVQYWNMDYILASLLGVRRPSANATAGFVFVDEGAEESGAGGYDI